MDVRRLQVDCQECEQQGHGFCPKCHEILEQITFTLVLYGDVFLLTRKKVETHDSH